MKKHLLIELLILFLFISCSEERDIEPRAVDGKWLLVEYYDGYANGGTFTWHNISIEDSHYLEFSADGSYMKQENANNSFQLCTGTFHHLPDNTLEVNSNCNSSTVVGKITELTTKHMVIDYQVIEGVIRYKYKSVNQ